jgi:hypothetical protein
MTVRPSNLRSFLILATERALSTQHEIAGFFEEVELEEEFETDSSSLGIVVVGAVGPNLLSILLLLRILQETLNICNISECNSMKQLEELLETEPVSGDLRVQQRNRFCDKTCTERSMSL